MIEESPGAKHYRDTQHLALTRLRDLEVALQHRLSTPLKYRMVSQAQAAPAEKAYFLWNKAGAILPQPAFDAATTRSIIYNQSAAARQLEAFLQVSGVIILELSQAAIRHFEAREIAASYMMIRSMVERIANVAALEDALQGKPLGWARDNAIGPTGSYPKVCTRPLQTAHAKNQFSWLLRLVPRSYR